MTDDRMLQAWREVRERMYLHMNPDMCPGLFERGWHARDLEMADLQAEIGGLKALVEHWKTLANER